MWTLEIKPAALKALQKIDTSNSKIFETALIGDLSGFWRYRIGDYRVICEINDKELILIAVAIGHRSKIYDK